MNKFKKIILEHNIPLYLCVDPHMKNTFVSYNLKYGSSGLWFNFNNDGKDYHVGSGYAHYLEHLLGEHSPFGNIYNNFRRRMMYANAFTSDDVTSYHFQGKGDLEKSISELIISMEQPTFDKKDVEETRHAIEEEAASSCNDYGVMVVDLVENNLYGGFSKYDHTLSPIGNRRTTKEITIDDLYNCYNAFYTDDRKFIIVAGNVDENRIVDCLNEALSKGAKHESHLVLPKIDFQGIRKRNDTIYRDIDEPIFSLGVKVKKPDFMTMKEFNYVITVLLEYSINSRAANELNRRGIIESFDYCYHTNVDDYLNYIVSFTAKDRDTCAQELLELLSGKDFSKKDYELMRNEIIASEIRSMESKYEYLEGFPKAIYYTEDYSDIDLYQSISYDSFSQMISTLDFSKHTTGTVKKLVRKGAKKN